MLTESNTQTQQQQMYDEQITNRRETPTLTSKRTPYIFHTEKMRNIKRAKWKFHASKLMITVFNDK